MWTVAVATAMCLREAQGARTDGAEVSADWDRYQVILDREPFGRAPKPGDTSAADAAAAAAAAAEAVPQGPGLAETVRLSVVTLYGGAPAAGFTDTTTGRSFYLFEGQTVKDGTTGEDYTLVAVNASGDGATLRKGLQEAELSLGVPAAPAGGTSSAASSSATSPAATPPSATRSLSVAAPGPAGTLSYAERQRQRAEEMRRRIDEARRRADEDKKNQDEQRLTGEAIKKRLREHDLNLIRAGQVPPQPIELTQDEVAQLASEGFDVNADPDASAAVVTPPARRLGPSGAVSVPEEQ